MDAKRIIALGDALREFEAEARAPTYEPPASALPPGCPLYTSLTGAGSIFGLGENTLRLLMKRNADFPALRLGKKVVVDVPGLYDWLHTRNGTTLIEE